MAFTTDDPGWNGSVTRFWQRTYAADYIGFSMLMTVYILVQVFLEPFHRMFSLDDRTKAFPHALHQRVTGGENILYAGVGPLILLILWALILRPGFHKAHVTILWLFISIFLTSTLTDIIKNAVGRPRPDLIARCKPRFGTPSNEWLQLTCVQRQTTMFYKTCGAASPSGHSSFAFSGFGYLALFLAGQLQVFRPGRDLMRTVVFFVPLTGAALIAMSRLADYRHDVYDVIAGSLLGFFIAHTSYRRYYRRLRHPKCFEPYPSPSEVGKRRRDEEHRGARPEDFDLDDLDDDEEALPLNNRR